MIMKINFENVKIYTDITRKNFFEADVKEQIADVIYKHGNGIRAHALALKIYNSKGETEFTDDEVLMISQAAENFCTPNFIDAIHEILNIKKEPESSDVIHIEN